MRQTTIRRLFLRYRPRRAIDHQSYWERFGMRYESYCRHMRRAAWRRFLRHCAYHMHWGEA